MFAVSILNTMSTTKLIAKMGQSQSHDVVCFVYLIPSLALLAGDDDGFCCAWK